jgi:hypothetical protein
MAFVYSASRSARSRETGGKHPGRARWGDRAPQKALDRLSWLGGLSNHPQTKGHSWGFLESHRGM